MLALLKHNQKKVGKLRERDPSLTLQIRSKYSADAVRRLRWIGKQIRTKLVDEDFLESGINTIKRRKIVQLAKFVYERKDAKASEFMRWLDEMEALSILELIQGEVVGDQPWANIYIQSSYQKGIAQGRKDLRAAGKDIPEFDVVEGGIAGAFNQPIHSEAVGMLYTRNFEALKDMTSTMDAALSRELAQGMAEGIHPNAIARKMVGKEGPLQTVGIVRARRIARTEVVNAFNEAQLNEYDRSSLIIDEPILAYWITTIDGRERDEHRGWNEQVMTISEARSRIGAPNCRCSTAPWIPSIDGMPKKVTNAARKVIKGAM